MPTRFFMSAVTRRLPTSAISHPALPDRPVARPLRRDLEDAIAMPLVLRVTVVHE
jgi:hypothetical protein